MTRIAVLGLGEAGSAIATDLVAAGIEVHGYDPAPLDTPPGVVRRASGAQAVEGCDLVIAATTASVAAEVLGEVASALAPDAVYGDLSTAAPALKRRLAEVADEASVAFADVALMAPVPGNGVRTPALVSGSGAEAFAATMRRLGMPVEVVGSEAGEAATRKLLRSVVMKGLAQLLIESLQAAEAARLTEETWDNLVAQLSSVDEALLHRLVVGTGLHARRRIEEMEATVELLSELGVDPAMTHATLARLRSLVDDPEALPVVPDSAKPRQ